MKNIAKNLAAMILAFMVAFTGVPVLSGTMEVNAATGTKALSVSARTNSVTLKWKKLTTKQKKRINGIIIFRNGIAIKKLSKKATSFTDAGLKAGTNYTYQVKTYQKKVKKTKMWKNKKTGLWQKRKPTRKYRGKSKTVKSVSYKYSNASPVKTIKTAAVARPAVATPNTSTSNTSNPSTSPKTDIIKDYLGVSRTISYEKDQEGEYYLTSDGAVYLPNQLCKIDRTIDGEFTVSGAQMKQVSGATFNLKQLTAKTKAEGAVWDSNLDRYFTAYNVDPAKLQFIPESGITTDSIASYEWPYLGEKADGSVNELNSITQYYFVKNGRRIARMSITGNPVEVKSVPNQLTEQRINYYVFPESNCGDGFIYTDTFTVTVKYDGKTVGKYTVNPDAEKTSDGMIPKRRLALDIAQAAIDWANSDEGKAYYAGRSLPPEGIYRDFRYISDYIYKTYTYDQNVSGYGVQLGNMHCTVGAYILETWGVYKYDKAGTGFVAWGNSTSVDHIAFHLNNDPSFRGEANGKH